MDQISQPMTRSEVDSLSPRDFRSKQDLSPRNYRSPIIKSYKMGSPRSPSSAGESKTPIQDPYQNGLLGTEHLKDILQNNQDSSEDQADEFLTSVELYFLQHLNRNEGLLEYFHYLQEGLVSLLNPSRVAYVDNLLVASYLIPEVSSGLVKLGFTDGVKPDFNFQEHLHSLSDLIGENQKTLIAQYISSKLTIRRRTYLTNLTMTQIQESVPQHTKLKLLFEDSNVFKLKAGIDVKIIETILMVLTS